MNFKAASQSMTVVEGKLKPVVAEKFAKNVTSHGGHRVKTVMKNSITLQGRRNKRGQGEHWSPQIFGSNKKVWQTMRDTSGRLL